ncbi:hypothetical protein [Fluviispira multicolorata]|uniref:Dolichyl-phosphate-mannose-protein mannosyltransferase n=1 Tax=Fluviispira multicolorata TaxID=2654512 RepID=A0A833JF33_9BACT|nr:hypothetical protein [Fluviispira multicolorata]KAB8030764.1 hypothetical protein GCL57_07260 [Fluviispira multicolorata]
MKKRLQSILYNQIFITRILTFSVFIFAYIYLIHDVNNTYWLFGDQTRDWRIASSNELQLIGTPILTGGYSFGPIFYWILSGIYHFIGPFFHYLPHVAVYGLSFINALSCAFLFFVFSKKYYSSTILILSLIILYITSPTLASIGATAWNPNLSAAFVNLSFGYAIYKGLFEAGYTVNNKLSIIIFVIFSWFALQSHSPAIFYTAGVLLFVFIKTKSLKLKFHYILIGFLVILILQTPYIIYMINNINELISYKNGTDQSFNRFLLIKGAFGKGFIYLFQNIADYIFTYNYIISYIIIYLSLLLICIFKKKFKDPLFQFSFLFLFLCYYGYSCIPSWSRENYLLVANIFPIAILPLFLLLKEVFKVKKFNIYLHIFILSTVIYLIPNRNSQKNTQFPFYKTLKITSKKIFETHKELQDIIVPDFKSDVDSTIIYEGYGGKIDPENKITAIIDNNGNVTYTYF